MDTPATESNQAQESTVQDRLAAILKSEHGDAFTYEKPDPEPKGQPDEPTAETAEPVETAEPESEAEPQEEPEGQPEAELETFEVDGKEYKVPPELKDHLLRDKDYRHKTMELAEEKKAVQMMRQYAEAAFQVSPKVIELIAGVKNADAELAKFAAVDWATLRSTNEVAYSTLQADQRQWLDYRNALVGQCQQADATIQQTRAVERQQALQRNEPLVKKAIPNWGPETKAALSEYALTQDYTVAELGELLDARQVRTLYKAYQYDQLQAKGLSTAKVVAAAPPVNKSTATRTSSREVEEKKLMQRLQKSGEPEDVIALLKLRRK